MICYRLDNHKWNYGAKNYKDFKAEMAALLTTVQAAVEAEAAKYVE